MKKSTLFFILMTFVTVNLFGQGQPTIPSNKIVFPSFFDEVKVKQSTGYYYGTSDLKLGEKYWEWSFPKNVSEPIVAQIGDLTDELPKILRDLIPVNQGLDWLQSRFDNIKFNLQGFADQSQQKWYIATETEVTWRFMNLTFGSMARRLGEPNPYIQPGNIGKLFNAEDLITLELQNLTRLNKGSAPFLTLGVNVDHFFPGLQKSELWTTGKGDKMVWGLRTTVSAVGAYDPTGIGLKVGFGNGDISAVLVEAGVPDIVAKIASEYIAGNNALLGVVDGLYLGGRVKAEIYFGKEDKWEITLRPFGEILTREDATMKQFSIGLSYNRYLNVGKLLGKK